MPVDDFSPGNDVGDSPPRTMLMFALTNHVAHALDRQNTESIASTLKQLARRCSGMSSALCAGPELAADTQS